MSTGIDPPVKRTKRPIRFTMSPEIHQLAKRMAVEQQQRKQQPQSVPAMQPEPSVSTGPARTVHRHAKVTAVLSANTNGFTLFNGVESVTELGNMNNAHLAEAVSEMKVRLLRCFDDGTLQKWTDVQKSYPELFENVKVSSVRTFEIEKCCYCRSNQCTRWQAAATMSHFHRVYFNPEPH